MKESLAENVFTVGDLLPDRNPYGILASLVSEVGELSEEVSILEGDSYKDEGPDGVLGEAVDVIICAYDLIRTVYPHMTEESINIYAREKIIKWKNKTLEKL